MRVSRILHRERRLLLFQQKTPEREPQQMEGDPDGNAIDVRMNALRASVENTAPLRPIIRKLPQALQEVFDRSGDHPLLRPLRTQMEDEFGALSLQERDAFEQRVMDTLVLIQMIEKLGTEAFDGSPRTLDSQNFGDLYDVLRRQITTIDLGDPQILPELSLIGRDERSVTLRVDNVATETPIATVVFDITSGDVRVTTAG